MKKIFYLNLISLTLLFFAFLVLPAKATTYPGTSCGADSHVCECVSGMHPTNGVECVLPYSWANTNAGASGCVMELNKPTPAPANGYYDLNCTNNTWSTVCNAPTYQNCNGSCVTQAAKPNANCTSWDWCGTCTACSNSCTLPDTIRYSDCTCVAGTYKTLKLGSYSISSENNGTTVTQSLTSPALFIKSSNVGINDSNPINNALSVVGNISGSAALKISSSTAINWISGNIGIGNASGGASKLSIFGNQSIGSSYFNDAAPADGLIVQGNVGIGTNNPGSSKLTIFDGDLTMLPNNNDPNIRIFGVGSIEASNSQTNQTIYSGLSSWGLYSESVNNGPIFYTTDSNVYVGRPMGINNPSPNSSFALDVNGIINASALYVNGVPYVGSQWLNTGTKLYYNDGNIGIGTNDPGTKLTVSSPLASVAFFKSTINGGNYSAYLGNGQTSSAEEFGLYESLSDTRLAVYDYVNSLSLYGSSLSIASNGNVGIGTGTTTPNFALDVNGTINASALYVNGSPYVGSQWTTASGSKIYYNSGNVGIGTADPGTKLTVSSPLASVAFFKSTINGGNYSAYLGNGQTSSAEEFGLYESLSDTRLAVYDYVNSLSLYGPSLVIDGSGNVGIGTTGMSTKFHLYDASSGPIISLSGLTTNYRGTAILNTSNAEQFFYGLNNSSNFVLRSLGSTDLLSASQSTGNISINTTPSLTTKFLINGSVNINGNDSLLTLGYLGTSTSQRMLILNTDGSVMAGSMSSANPVYATSTTIKYNGKNDPEGSSGTSGYQSPYTACQNILSGSRVCTPDDMLNTISVGGSLPVNDVWIFSGPPGFNKPANDCFGRTSNSSVETYGAYWQAPSGGGKGMGLLMTCNVYLRIACCK